MNPLFDDHDTKRDHRDPRKPKDTGYIISRQPGKVVQPISKKHPRYSEDDTEKKGTVIDPSKDAAIELIRRKLDAVYEDEPDAKKELQEAEAATTRSAHQQVMHELSTSGRSPAEIQIAWHAYYAGLSDSGKHEVWREFYAKGDQPTATGAAYKKAAEKHATETAIHKAKTVEESAKPEAKLQLHPEADAGNAKVVVVEHLATPTPPVATKAPVKHTRSKRATNAIRKHVIEKVQLNAVQQQKAKQHFHSLLFGIGSGVVVIVVFLFSFFNEMIIAPFIQPSRTVSSTPIILTNDSVAVSETPEVIIPKINVQIPVDYNQTSVVEEDFQTSLESGVVHYASTSKPGEQGNTAIFGHSSNNIFNKGKYKFAFVKLSELVPGDIFYLTRDKKIYTYRVYDKRIVEPTQTEVLRPVDGKVTATLITCDPPGTSKYRLVVWGEQISPDPTNADIAATPPPSEVAAAPAEITGKGPTLWGRLTKWLF